MTSEQSGPFFQSLWCMLFNSYTDSKTHVLFRAVLFNLQNFVISHLSFLLLSSSLIPLWSENRLHMISVLYLLKCVLWARMWSIILVYISSEIDTICILLLLGETVLDVYYIHLVNGGVEFSYVCTDFLPAGSIQQGCRDAEISNYDSGFISSSLQFY